MGSRSTDKKDFTRIGVYAPTTRLITIQCVFNSIDAVDSDRSYIDRALDELRCFGAAEIVEAEVIKEDFDEATKILRKKGIR